MARFYGVDTSNWTGEIPLESAKCMRSKGFDKAIINLYNGPLARQQYDSYKGANFRSIDGYIYFEFDKDGITQLREQLDHLEGRIINRLWIDCEDDFATHLTEAQTVQYIWRIVDACKGLVNTGIYTRYGWWTYQTGNDVSLANAGLPLWDATNDNTADMSFTQYGGWAKSYMEQYAFDVALCGETVDLNVYEEEEPTPTEPTLELAYTGYSNGKHNYNLTVEIGDSK